MGHIYKIWNEINEKVYIGQTIRPISERWNEHKRDSQYGKQHLYYAIRKYGLKYFHIEEIEECENLLLNEKEKYWINFYNSYKNGYNMTLGGQGTLTTNQYQDEQIYKLWDEGYCISEIARILKLKSTQPVKNRLHDYENYTQKESEYRGQKSSAKQKEKKIYQWTRYGDFIQEFNSEKEAAKATGIDYKAINQALNKGKHTSGNFVWSFEKVFPNKLLWQCDMQGNKIKCFIDSGDASRQLKFDASSIRKVVRGEKPYYKNFKWIED